MRRSRSGDATFHGPTRKQRGRRPSRAFGGVAEAMARQAYRPTAAVHPVSAPRAVSESPSALHGLMGQNLSTLERAGAGETPVLAWSGWMQRCAPHRRRLPMPPQGAGHQ